MTDTLISRPYLKEQIKLHGCGYYGFYSDKWTQIVLELVGYLAVNSILDYGCGQGKLVSALRKTAVCPVVGYDPAVPRYAELPEPADLVVCTDVLEHIEPDRLEAVLAHLASVTSRWLFVVIATRPATKLLSNGENAHLIIQPEAWWIRTLAAHGWQACAMPVELSPVLEPALETAGLWQPPGSRT